MITREKHPTIFDSLEDIAIRSMDNIYYKEKERIELEQRLKKLCDSIEFNNRRLAEIKELMGEEGFKEIDLKKSFKGPFL